MSALCVCGPRQPQVLTPRAKRLSPDGDQSPVSAYCSGELDADEKRAFVDMQARNHELRWLLGITGKAPMMNMEQQVKEHVVRLRKAVADNARLRNDLVQVQTSLMENGLALSTPADSLAGSVDLSFGKGGLPQPVASSGCQSEATDTDEQERCAAGIMGDIQALTQGNIELISQYDEEVKNLEEQVNEHRRRQQAAESNLCMPSSSRSLRSPTPPRSSRALDEGGTPRAADVADNQQLDELREKRAELRQVEQESTRLEEAIQAEMQNHEGVKARALQELQMAHEVQKEELAHFRRLVEEKRQKGKMMESPQQGDSGALLHQELDHLREHFRDVQQRGEQEREAAEAQASELRQELQSSQEELRNVAAERDASFCELEAVQRANDGKRTPPANAQRPLELQRMHGEALAKEIERTRRRIELLDYKVEQLESEAQDLRQRANLVLSAMPDKELEGVPNSPEASARISELQQVVAIRQASLHEFKREEDQLQGEVAKAQKDLETANVETAVMERKMRLLQSRM